MALTGGLAALTLVGGSSHQKRNAQTQARTQALVLALEAVSALGESGLTSVPGVQVSDASSAVNPNWVRADLLDHSPLKAWFLAGRTGTDFAQDRSDRGFSTDPERWSDWFRLDLLTQRMTFWGPWPVNAADEIALQDAYLLRTGDKAAADRFRQGIRRYRQERKLMSDKDLRALAEPYSDSVAGAFSASPPWNVNLLPEEQLRALLAYVPFALPDPAAVANRLLDERSRRHLTSALLPGLTQLPADHALFAYLGDRTGVWKVTVPAGHETLVSYWMDGRPIAREWAVRP